MKARWLFLLALILAAAGILSAVDNRKQALNLASAIVAKDRAAADVTADIDELKQLSNQHMGSSQTLFLAGSYDRAVAAAKTTTDPAASSRIYAEAQASCASLKDSISQSSCISSYLSKNMQPAPNPKPAELPSKDKYTIAIGSPLWSPDMAGALLLGAAAAAALGIIKLIFGLGRRRQSKRAR